MFPVLNEKSFLKIKPNEFLYSPFANNVRESLKINKTAFEILSLCNGDNSITDIINILKDRYNDSYTTVEKNVKDFLTPLFDLGVIYDIHSAKPSQSFIRGNKNIFYPDVLIWEITDYCPLNCKHCYLPKKNNNVFTKKDIDKILDMIFNCGIFQVQLTGGEALSHPHFDYIIDKLIEMGVIISISTSGFIFNDKLKNSLVKIKNIEGSFVRVSVDGNEKTHNILRRNEQSYERVLKFIKEMKSNDIPCQVGVTVVDQSFEELKNITSTVKKLGASLIEFGLITVQGNAQKNFLNSKVSAKKLSTILNELSKKFSDEKFVVRLPNKNVKLKNCSAGYQIITLKANKDLTICPTAEFKLGNIDNDSVYDIMKKYGHNFFDITSPNEELCQNCERQLECKGCITRALVVKKSVKRCFWFEKQQEKFKLFFNN